MNIELLKYLGNIDQVAGIRESQVLRGRGEQMHIAEFYNAAGLRFTVMPDRCMDLYDLSYKGVNFSFQTKNGMLSPQGYCPTDGEFGEEWPAGMMVTCGLDNVGGHCHEGGEFPTHGRISHMPCKRFGTRAHWEGNNYILRANGEVHQGKLFGRHLSLERTIETGLNDKSLKIHDVITNHEAEDEPYFLLYHVNFGYPIVQMDSVAAFSKGETIKFTPNADDPIHMSAPIDGKEEELFFHLTEGDKAYAVIYNERLELGAYVAYDTKYLPRLLQWKSMKSHDYVLGLEPCNTWGVNRAQALKEGKAAILPAYSSVETDLEIGILDGAKEIQAFLKKLG